MDLWEIFDESYGLFIQDLPVPVAVYIGLHRVYDACSSALGVGLILILLLISVVQLITCRRQGIYVIMAGSVVLRLFPGFRYALSPSKRLTRAYPVSTPCGWKIPNPANYQRLFELIPRWQNLHNRLFTTILGTLTTLFFCELAGFNFSKYRFSGRSCFPTWWPSAKETLIGRLDAYCETIRACCTSNAGIAYPNSGALYLINHTIVHLFGILSGTLCDGVRPACAAKIASGAEPLIGYQLTLNVKQFCGGECLGKEGGGKHHQQRQPSRQRWYEADRPGDPKDQIG